MMIYQLIRLSAQNAQNRQQALKNIDGVHVNRKRCTDVIGFATIDDAFDVIKHKSTEYADS